MGEIPTRDLSWIDEEAMRFEREWQAGCRPRIEDFLAHREEPHRAPLLKELLRVECELRRKAGDSATAGEYGRRFPGHAGVIDSVFHPQSCGSSGPVPSEPAGSDAEAGAIPPELADHTDYDVLRPLGGGGMGMVYLAHNRILGRDEALKVISREIIELPDILDRFLREIRAVAGLEHPNIVTAYSAFRAASSLVLAMEYVEGLDLSRLVKAKGPLPVANACSYAHQAALGLQHAHEQGLVHRDIKPGNLMLSSDGGRPLIKMLDFGLAKAGREQGMIEFGPPGVGGSSVAGLATTRTGQMLGTPDFIAPEQITDAQSADIRADIYSLGCTLYHLLTGQPPFRRETLYDVLQAHQSAAAPLVNLVRPEVPVALAALVAKMMAKEPRRRFQTPAEVAEALVPFMKKRALDVDDPRFSTSPDSPLSAPLGDFPPPPVTDPIAAFLPGPRPASARTEPLLAGLIHTDEAEDDDDATDATDPGGGRPSRNRTFVFGVTGLALLLLGVVVLANKERLLGGAPRGNSPGAEASAPGRASDDDEAQVEGIIKPPIGPSGASSPATTAGSTPRQRDEPPAVPLPTAPPTATAASGDSDRKASNPRVEEKTPPPLIKSPRWVWIHDASLREFDRWVDGCRARGFHPVFVNAHDPTSRLAAPDELGTAASVRIAAIAIEGETTVPFEVHDKVETDNVHWNFRDEMGKRGYTEISHATYNDGTNPHILTIYTRSGPANGFYYLYATDLPEHTPSWHRDGWRPFSVATRPAGDLWRATIAMTGSRDRPWRLERDLDYAGLRVMLDGAQGGGFYPESLFVCPSKAGVGFGVVLTRNDSKWRWEPLVELTSSGLESAAQRMSELGYIPDQVVGYGVGGKSRYLACWKRDPRWSPATGLYEPSLESLDEAIEQFLIHRRIPSCTFAAFQNGRPDPVLSRGFGYADRDKQMPIGPRVAMDLGELSVPFEAAAVRALVRRKKLLEDERLSDIVHAAKKSDVTLGRLLASLERPDARLGEKEREALNALLDRNAPAPTGQEPTGALELEAVLLGRVLESVTGKPPEKAIITEVAQPQKLRGVAPAGVAHGHPDGLVHLAAPAPELGQFFLKHELDGRPVSPPAKPTDGSLLGRRRTALGLVRRRGEWLFVLLLNIPADAPPELGIELRICLDHAVDSLPPSPAPTGQRRVPVRKKGGAR